MTGTRAGVLLLTLALMAWSAPTALANDDVPLCDDITEHPAAVENYYLYEDDAGNLEAWEEANGLEGLQHMDCKELVDEEAETDEDRYEMRESDVAHATVPVGDVEGDVDEAISDIADTVPSCIPVGGSTVICF